MSSSASLPSPDDDYAAPPDARLNKAFWDAALKSVGARIRALEAIKADWEALIATGTGQALEVISANVEPQLAVLTTTIHQLKADVALAQDVIASIITGSVPASAVSETPSRIWLTPAFRDLWNSKQAGDPTLSALAALETSADKLIYATGQDTFALATITALARNALASGTSQEFLTKIGAASAEDMGTALAAKASTALVSTKASKRNRHLNPAFQICQDRAAGATIAISVTSYMLDGVKVDLNGGAVLTCQQALKDTPGGSPTRIRLSVSTAKGSYSGTEYAGVSFPIEGIDVADLQFGTVSAKPVYWRGIVNLPAGTYGLSFSNGDGTRSYVTTFTVAPAQAGTDVLVTASIPGDTSGSWIKNSSGVGLIVRIAFAAGPTLRTTVVDAWQNGNFTTTAAQVNATGSTANILEFADIGLYAGAELPVWELPDFGEQLGKCLRYYATSYDLGVAPGTVTALGAIAKSSDFSSTSYLSFGVTYFPGPMRVVPTLAFYNPADGNTSNPVRDTAKNTNKPIGIDSLGTKSFMAYVNNAGANQGNVHKFHYVANARL